MRNSWENSWKALKKKWKAVSEKERTILIVKLCLRLIGIRKCLFLGGYREEEDLRQRQQDWEIYEHLREKAGKHTDNIEKQKALSDKYIALMTENLDVGGMEEVIKLLAEELTARGIRTRVFCAQEGGRIEKELSRKGIETVVFHGNKKLFTEYVKKNPPSLINTHYVQSFIAETAGLGIPIVEVIHNMYVFLTEKQIHTEREKAKYISTYIAVSQKAKEVYLTKIPSAYGKGITVIGNCGRNLAIEKDDHEYNRAEIRKKYNIASNTFVLACIGSVDARKNQLGILRAWDIVKRITVSDVCLMLVGETTDVAYEKKIRELIKQRELDDSVKIIGQCKQISQLLDAVNAVIIDSYYEGWSMAATEALCKGVPIIHADCGSGTELVAKGQNGYLTGNVLSNMLDMTHIQLNDTMHAGVNDNIAETAAAILDAIEKKDDWEARREKIREYADRHFSKQKMVEEYLKIYYKVL